MALNKITRVEKFKRYRSEIATMPISQVSYEEHKEKISSNASKKQNKTLSDVEFIQKKKLIKTAVISISLSIIVVAIVIALVVVITRS